MADEVIYFVSDTHLGDGTGADRFRYPREFAGLLERIQAEPGARLVLLGDFMELWAASLEPILMYHAPIFHAIGRIAANQPVTYVVGNHDCLPWYRFVGFGSGNIEITEQFTAARGALVAVHGHQYDPFNQVKVDADGLIKVPLTRKLTQVLGFLERVMGPSVGDAVIDVGERLSKAILALDQRMPDLDEGSRTLLKAMLSRTRDTLERESPGERGYPPGEENYENAARALMRKGARFVLLGHTHHPLKHTYGHRVYVNTGSWVWDRYPPTYARFAGGQLELYDARTHRPYTRKPGD